MRYWLLPCGGRARLSSSCECYQFLYSFDCLFRCLLPSSAQKWPRMKKPENDLEIQNKKQRGERERKPKENNEMKKDYVVHKFNFFFGFVLTFPCCFPRRYDIDLFGRYLFTHRPLHISQLPSNGFFSILAALRMKDRNEIQWNATQLAAYLFGCIENGESSSLSRITPLSDRQWHAENNRA